MPSFGIGRAWTPSCFASTRKSVAAGGLLRVLVGRGEQQQVVADVRHRRPDLRAVDPEAVAVALGRRDHPAEEVGAGAGLGHRDRRDHLALGEAGDELLLEVLGGEALDRLRVELIDAPDPGDPGQRTRDLLHEDALDHRAAALATELLVDADPEEARLGHVVPELAREVRAVVVLVALELEGHLLRALVLDPVVDRAPEVVLLVAEPEVHLVPPRR